MKTTNELLPCRDEGACGMGPCTIKNCCDDYKPVSNDSRKPKIDIYYKGKLNE